MDYAQQINAWFNTFEHRMAREVPNIVAETASEFFQDRFKTQEWDKVPWQPLSPKYAVKKSRGKGRILTSSGLLQRSIRPSVVQPSRVTISAGNAKVPYARVHNEGLTVRGNFKVRGHIKKNFMGKGKAKRVNEHFRSVNYTMPRRQFMGHSPFLNTIIRNRLINHFNA